MTAGQVAGKADECANSEPSATREARNTTRSNCEINRDLWVHQWRVPMTSSVAAKAPKKSTKGSQQVRAEIEDGCNTSKANGQVSKHPVYRLRRPLR
jgi:hypothetical protein